MEKLHPLLDGGKHRDKGDEGNIEATKALIVRPAVICAPRP